MEVLPAVHGLIVANHRSYFDPIVTLHHRHTFPVRKKEVESWPLIGYLCKISGVIFVDRKDPKSRQNTFEKIKEALNKDILSSIFLKEQQIFHPLQSPLITDHLQWLQRLKQL
jgi:1-acyl-sn-glycerol-3-phosphate acyltransferase